MSCGLETYGSLTISVTKIGVLTVDFPFQMFGAVEGAHKRVQTGLLSDFVPLKFAVATDKKIVRETKDGDVEFIDRTDPANEVGVKLSCNKIPYIDLLEMVQTETAPSNTAVVLASTKLTHTKESARAQVLTVRERGYFNVGGDKTIDLAEYFEAGQQQSNILMITKSIELTPVKKIDSLFSADETKLSFTFTASAS